MSIFGVIVAGRLPQLTCEVIATNKYLINIPDAETVNHLVVFLTGTAPLPPGTGGSVYFSWPDAHSPQSWQYLGFISNEKPSAVFRLTRFKQKDLVNGVNGRHSAFEHSTFLFNQTTISTVAQIGISIEPLSEINQQTPPSNGLVENFSTFTLKTAENLFNYASSFAKSVPGIGDQLVPLSVIQAWYTTYKKKLEMNPDFWRS